MRPCMPAILIVQIVAGFAPAAFAQPSHEVAVPFGEPVPAYGNWYIRGDVGYGFGRVRRASSISWTAARTNMSG